MFESIDQVQEAFGLQSYIMDRSLATAFFLAGKLEKPIFLEGEAGVGKTEASKALASILGTHLVRLQCYEGLDARQALYEWNYSRQMLHIRMQESAKKEVREEDLFSEKFLLKRPLLEAITSPVQTVLLIDEIDRSDVEFEAFLLEILSDFQITIPEIGTIQAVNKPFVVITSNQTREVHDALKRRCLYTWIEFPAFDKELEIVRIKNPGIQEKLASDITHFVQALRKEDLYKKPGVAETLDWANALVHLSQNTLSEILIDQTMGVLLKHRDDIESIQGQPVRNILESIGIES